MDKEKKIIKKLKQLADLIKEQKVQQNERSTVHHRRDLDSLG